MTEVTTPPKTHPQNLVSRLRKYRRKYPRSLTNPGREGILVGI